LARISRSKRKSGVSSEDDRVSAPSSSRPPAEARDRAASSRVARTTAAPRAAPDVLGGSARLLVPFPGCASRGARPRARGHVVRARGPIHGLRGERVRERVERALRLERHDRRIARPGALAKRQPRGGARDACRRHSHARPDLETTTIEPMMMSPKRAAEFLGRGRSQELKTADVKTHVK
jgi:hypothetical protein